jgi:hypothetical protein
MSSVAPFEEYKLFVEDTARFTDRRQTVTNICVTINSVLLSAVALLVKDAGLQRWVIVPATITIFVAGIAICFVWWQLICKYKRLVKLRINKLRAMENLPEMAGCQGMYHAEDDMYKRDTKDQLIEGIASSFSDLERFLPFVFMFLYLVFGIAIVVARCQGLI